MQYFFYDDYLIKILEKNQAIFVWNWIDEYVSLLTFMTFENVWVHSSLKRIQ